MAMTLGGRAAEEIVFGEITTGASNDLEKVTETAKQMVMRFGMSERLGPRVFGHDRGQPFLGREFSSEPDYSDEIAREIDDEIRRIVEERPPDRQGPAHRAPRGPRHGSRRSCSSARRSTPSSSSPCSTASSEDEVFGDEEEPTQPAEPAPEPERAQREGPRPMPRPRPGFAGGDAPRLRCRPRPTAAIARLSIRQRRRPAPLDSRGCAA